MNQNKKPGKLIVIDGGDGTGKTTQYKLLIERLTKDGLNVGALDFPRYEQPSAWFVTQYLNGSFGTINEVNPYQASVFYALDRYVVGKDLRQSLEEGKYLIANRYVTASMGHQGAKFNNSDTRKKFFEWLYNFEYELMGIPKPDLCLILHIPAKIAQDLVLKKDKRDYLEGGAKKDLHEKDLDHLTKAEQVFIDMADNYEEIKLIECFENNKLLSIEEIHEKIYLEIKKIL